MITILDPEHGGRFPGAVASNGIMEKQITLCIAKEAKAILEASGEGVFLTRETDSHLGETIQDDIQARMDFARDKGAQCYVTISGNSVADPAPCGVVSFFAQAGNWGHKLAASIHYSQMVFCTPTSRGVIQRPGLMALRVAQERNLPACLTETGFLSNKADLLKLSSHEGQRQIGLAIALGILSWKKWYGIE